MNPIQVLVVDDDPNNIFTLVNYLEHSFPDMEVLQALTGKMALLAARDALPDLIITDWEMPGMNGLELIGHLKADESTRDIPAIMCTGAMISQEHLMTALGAGASDFIRKPVDPVELVARVRSMLTMSARTKEIIEEQSRHAITLAELEKERAEKAAHKALVEKEQAEQAAQMKKQFFSMITHEFRTPLTLILGPLEKITNDTREAFTKRLSETALRNSQVMLNLVDQLLTLARLESGFEVLKPYRMDFAQYTGEKSTLFIPLARKKDISIEISSHPESLWMDFDPHMMARILNNLLSNAVKYTPSKGTVQVRTELVPQTDTVMLLVKDSGQGIPSEQVPFVFDHFFRATSQPAGTGTGLGLPLTKLLVEMHGGEIQLTSIEGLGTEVKVILPLEQSEVSRDGDTYESGLHSFSDIPTLTHPEIEAFEGEEDIERKDNVVLVIEDNPEIRDYIRLFLEPEYHVIEAEDGSSGIEKAKKYLPDLIITDVMMPGMNGFEVCKYLKEEMTTSHIPIIILTAKSDLEDKIEGLESKADDFLNKPFHEKELKARIKNLILNRRKLQENWRRSMATSASTEGLQSREEQFLQQVRKIMEERISDENLNVEYFSTEMAMSRTQLFRKLKAITGQSAGEFIRNYRLEHAYNLLEKDVSTISEIAHLVGFSTASYFSKAFSTKYGISPKEVRKGKN